MEYSGILAMQMIKMFIFILAGLALLKTSILKESDGNVLGTLLLYLIMPVTVINAFISNSFTAEELFLSFGLSLMVFVISITISVLVFRKDPVSAFGASFPNSGFIGIPLVSAVLGDKAVMYISTVISLTNAFQWVLGEVLFADKKEKSFEIRKLILNPMILSFVIGLILNPIAKYIPSLLKDCTSSIAACNSPLAMIILGINMGKVAFKDIFFTKKAYLVSLFRLILIPFVTIILFSAVPSENITIKLAIMISSVAPVGSNTAIYARKYGKNYDYAVVMTCLSTLLSIITVPLVVQSALNIWN